MTNGIRVREFNEHLHVGTARFRRFSGATAKRLQHYVLPTLIEETPDVAIIHVGGNDLPTKKSNPSSIVDIAKSIIDTGILCLNYNVKDIFICGIIRRNVGYMEKRRVELNDLLKRSCKLHSFIFIDNDNIERTCLARDNVHLNEEGSLNK